MTSKRKSKRNSKPLYFRKRKSKAHKVKEYLEKAKSKKPYPQENPEDYKNEVEIGRDGNEYISKPDNYGVYRWKKMSMKDNPFDYYAQFNHKSPIKYDYLKVVKELKKVAKELNKHNIFLFEVGWKNIGDDLNLAYKDACKQIKKTDYYKKLKKKIDDFNCISNHDYSFLFYSQYDLYTSSYSGELYIPMNMINKEHSEIVDKILTEHFGKKYNRKGLTIQLDKIKK